MPDEHADDLRRLISALGDGPADIVGRRRRKRRKRGRNKTTTPVGCILCNHAVSATLDGGAR
jgi:hypothetical protein